MTTCLLSICRHSAWQQPSSSTRPGCPRGDTEGGGAGPPPFLAREGHPLRHALVDDVARHLGEAVDVGLAGAEVAPLYGVVEEAPDAVAVVLVVLRRVDAALRGDRMGAAGAVLEAEALHLLAALAEGRRR